MDLPPEVRVLHLKLATLQHAGHLPMQVLREQQLGFEGCEASQERQLTQVLTKRGVPPAAVGERIKQAVAKIGAATGAGILAQALQGKNVWQLLKAAANKPGLNFRRVNAEELQQHIAIRTEQKFGTQVPRANAKKAKLLAHAKQPLQVDPPAQLLLASGSCVSSSGAPLGQLSFAESIQQASPVLKNGKNLSVDALALLITTPVALEEWGRQCLDFTIPVSSTLCSHQGGHSGQWGHPPAGGR